MDANLSTHYVVRKLHSLTGIVPVGLFLIEHIFTNSFAVRGPGDYDRAVEFLQGIPYLPVFEACFIILPLYFHGLYGLIITYDAGFNARNYPGRSNVMYLLQRASGAITLVFVTAHVYMTRWANLASGVEINFETVSEHLSSGWMFGFYALGVLAAVFHFANGAWNFSITWGIVVGRGSQRAFWWCCIALGAAMYLAGLNALFAFAGRAVVF
ncbi:MAG: succinate dehydrogenase [bacterium]